MTVAAGLRHHSDRKLAFSLAHRKLSVAQNRNGRATSYSCSTRRVRAATLETSSLPSWQWHGLAAQTTRSKSISFFAEHANRASGNLK